MKIFISYGRNDGKDLAFHLYKALVRRDMDVFLDDKKIPKGKKWEDSIYRNINDSNYFILIATHDAIDSDMVNKEVNHARSLSYIQIIPYKYHTLEWNQLKWDLSKIQGDTFETKEELVRKVFDDILPKSDTVNQNIKKFKPKPLSNKFLHFQNEKKFFVGREEYINKILKDVIINPGSRVAIIAPGGSGKSQLAFKALHQYYEIDKFLSFVIPLYLYPSISFQKFLNDIGFYLIENELLNLSIEEFEHLSLNESKSTIYNVLRNINHPLIYCDNFETISDNVEENSTNNNTDASLIIQFLNNELPYNVSLLVTSRNRKNFLTEQHIELTGLKVEKGIDLFISHASPYKSHLLEKKNIKLSKLLNEIVMKTGGHPLSIEILAYSYEGGGETELELILSTLGRERKHPFEPEERLKTLHKCFEYSIEKLDTNSLQLLSLLTLFKSPFPSEAINKIFNLNSEHLKNLYNKCLISRIEGYQYGSFKANKFWLYFLHPETRNFLQDKYKAVFEFDTIIQYCQYYHNLLLETYNSLCKDFHLDFIGQFEIITQREDNDFEMAIEFLQNIKSDGSINKETRQICLQFVPVFILNLALIYQYLGHYTKTFNYHKKALQIYEELNDKVGMARCYNDLGVDYINRGLYDEALTYHKKALQIYEELNDKVGMARCLSNIGLSYRNKGHYDDALSYHNSALEIYKNLNNSGGLALEYLRIGSSYHNKGHYDDALTYHMKAFEIDKNEDDNRVLAEDYVNIGNDYFKLGHYDDAFTYYKKALQIYEELNDKVGMAMSYTNLSGIYTVKGNYDDTLDLLNKSLAIHQELNDSVGMAVDFGNIGNLYKAKANYDEAIKYYKKALEINESLNDKIGIADSYTNIGLANFRKQFYDEAIKYYKKALEINESLNDKVRMATNYDNIGTVYKDTHKYYHALLYHNKSLKIYKELNDKVGIAGSYNDIGLIYPYLNLLDDALNHFNKSLEIYEILQDKLKIADIHTNIGLAYLFEKMYNQSIEYLFKSLQINEKIGDKVRMARNYGNIATTYKELNEFDKALEYYKKALEINESLNDKVRIASNYVTIAQIYLTKNMKKDSKSYLEKALTISKNLEKDIGNNHPLLSNIKQLLNRLG